ncbi:hypothetical protein J3F83DRAFT_742646 [Trichoderma novae-zelandiae]
MTLFEEGYLLVLFFLLCTTVGCIKPFSRFKKRKNQQQKYQGNHFWARQRLSTPPAAAQGFPSFPSIHPPFIPPREKKDNRGRDAGRVSFPHKYSQLRPKKAKSQTIRGVSFLFLAKEKKKHWIKTPPLNFSGSLRGPFFLFQSFP